MSRSTVGRLLAIGPLLAIYLLTLGSLAPGDIAIGLLLAALMELGWRHRITRGGSLGSAGDVEGAEWPPLRTVLAGLPALIGIVFVEITRGTWEVAKYSLGLREVDDDGVVEIELEGVSEAGMAAWAYISTISPGEIAIEIDEERGVLVIHALAVGDPAAIRARHKELYERYQRRVVP